MKLDANVLRYLSKEDFRVLTAVEMGQKNHELVPMQLIDSISGLKHGGAHRSLKVLLQHKLVHHESQKYDGYRLTYMGYDFLALKALVARGHISGVGRQIGVGKESDIFEVMNDEGEVFALKLHRLGRTSFRDVKSKRDYLGTRSSYSWLYLSRLAALKEFAFMKALADHGFPVPGAIDNNRHAVLMELVDAQPLVQVRELGHPADVYTQAMTLIHQLAAAGLVHCDFNEFNLLIDESEHLTLIDFPQMVSISHANAQELFERDVDCIIRFFNKKIGYMPQQDDALPFVRPSFEAAIQEAAAAGASGLDVQVAASGFNRHHQTALERFAAGAEAEDGSSSGSEEAESDAASTGTAESTSSTKPLDCGDGEASGVPRQERIEAGSADEQGQGALPEIGIAAGDGTILQESGQQQCEAVVGSSDNNRGSDHNLQAAVQQVEQKLAEEVTLQEHVGALKPQLYATTRMQQWLSDQHQPGTSTATAVGGPVAAVDGTLRMCPAAANNPAAGPHTEEGAPDSAANAHDNPVGDMREFSSIQQQQDWEQSSAVHSRAPTDLTFMGREVQQRLVAQRQKAAARVVAAKATRNVSKSKGKKARATASALSDW